MERDYASEILKEVRARKIFATRSPAPQRDLLFITAGLLQVSQRILADPPFRSPLIRHAPGGLHSRGVQPRVAMADMPQRPAHTLLDEVPLVGARRSRLAAGTR